MAAVGRGYGSGPRLEPCGSPVLRLSHEERPNQRRREERVGERLVFDVQQRRRACVRVLGAAVEHQSTFAKRLLRVLPVDFSLSALFTGFWDFPLLPARVKSSLGKRGRAGAPLLRGGGKQRSSSGCFEDAASSDASLTFMNSGVSTRRRSPSLNCCLPAAVAVDTATAWAWPVRLSLVVGAMLAAVRAT